MTQGTTKGVPIDTDPTMAANSNELVASQAATVTYVAAEIIDFSDTPTITALKLAAGTATANTQPIEMTSGTLLTAVEAGSLEYDGKVFYSSPTTAGRGVVPSTQFIILQNDFTASTATGGTGTKIFDSPTNGTFAISANTLYEFDGMISFTNDSTSANKNFGIVVATGTATMSYQYRVAFGATDTVLTGNTTKFGATAGVVILASANTTTGGALYMRGHIYCTVAGTIVPVFSQSANANFVFKKGSFFNIWAKGTDTVVSVGGWT